ncbi:MAG TPA: DUF4388 domain-containing protein [Myxococcales bacterium]|nr:DUF4388 domain-containing protein [Myxococcales bacterium]
MDTFELLPSLAQGELADTSAPELVAAVFRARASGTLWLETPQSPEIRVFFRAGDMCGSGPFEGFQTLAHVLLANDWVDALDIDSSREEAMQSNRRHGEVLIAKGLLTPEQLRSALVAQHTTNLALVLGIPQGKYDWRGWEPPPPWAREVVVDPVAALADALEKEKHAARRRKVIEWLGDNRVRLSLDWPELQGRIQLGQLDRRAAALLALPRKLDEFVQASRLERARAEALLTALLLCGGAEPQPVSAAPSPRAAEPVVEPAPPPAMVVPEPEAVLEPAPLLEPLPEVTLTPVEEVVAEPEPELFPNPHPPPEQPAAMMEALEVGQPDMVPKASAPRRATVGEAEALERLDALSLDEMPDTPPGPPAVLEEELEIDHARAKGARVGGNTAQMVRDENTFEVSSGGSQLEPAGGADEAVAREMRKKMMARSLRNMGAQAPKRGEAENSAAVEAMPGSQQGSASIDTSKLSADDKLFVDEVRVRAKRAPLQNPYVRLGLQPGAKTDEIKKAYLEAAKRFHPDRSSSPGLGPLLPDLQILFRMLKDAYEQIGTTQARDKYEQAQKSGGKASRKDESALAVKMGEVLLKKRDFDGALNKLRHAVELDPNGDSLAALAWALVSDPRSTPQSKEEAASLVQRALKAPGLTGRTFYVAGVLWRTKDPDSAVEAFRKALDLDPNHPDAALELRLIEQRRGKTQKPGGGVLSGIFGKRKS